MARLVQVQPRGEAIRFPAPDDWGISGGVGGWEATERPLSTDATLWRRRPLYVAMFEMVIGDDSKSVEPELRLLERWGQPRGGDGEPPRLRVVANTWPLGDKLFVIDDLDRATSEVETLYRGGKRTRAAVLVTLLEHVEAQVVVRRRAGAGKGKNKPEGKGRGSGGKTRTYVVKRGDNLSKIAARLLGDASRWQEIAKLNKLRDPNRINIGQKLKIPAK